MSGPDSTIEVVEFIEVEVATEKLGVILKPCKGLLGGVYIHSKVPLTHSINNDYPTVTTNSNSNINYSSGNSSSSSSSSSNSNGSNSMTKVRGEGIAGSSVVTQLSRSSTSLAHSGGDNSPQSGSLTDHIGAVLYSLNDEVVLDYSLEMFNKKLIVASRPYKLRLINHCNTLKSEGIVDIVKDPRKIKFLYEYLLKTNENSEELLGSTIMASVSILVNHYKELDIGLAMPTQDRPDNTMKSKSAVDGPIAKGHGKDQYFDRLSTTSAENKTNCIVSLGKTSIQSYQTVGICDDIARDLNCSFMPKFLSSEIASRMFGFLYKCPKYFQCSQSNLFNNYIHMIIYYFYSASLNLKCENVMHAVWKSLNLNNVDDVQVVALGELCGAFASMSGSNIDPATIFSSNYLQGELFSKFKASDYYDLLMIPQEINPDNDSSNLSPQRFQTPSCLCYLEKMPLSSKRQFRSPTGAASVLGILRKQYASGGNISFHKSRYTISTRNRHDNSNGSSSFCNNNEDPTDIWIANIDDSVQIIDYFKIKGASSNKRNFKDDVKVAHDVKSDSESADEKIMSEMQRNAPFIMPNGHTTASLPRAHYAKPKLISGSFCSAEGKVFYSLSLLYYEIIGEDTATVLSSKSVSSTDDDISNGSTADRDRDDFDRSNRDYSPNSSSSVPKPNAPGQHHDAADLRAPTFQRNVAQRPPGENVATDGNHSINSKIESTFRLTSELFSNMFTNTSSFFDQSNQLKKKSPYPSSAHNIMPTNALSVLKSGDDDLYTTTALSISQVSPDSVKTSSNFVRLQGQSVSDPSKGKNNLSQNRSRAFKQSNINLAIPKGLSIISNQDIHYLRSFLANKYMSESNLSINPKDIKDEIETYIQFTNKEQDSNITSVSDCKDIQLSNYLTHRKAHNSYIVSNVLKWATIVDLITAAVLECKILLWTKVSGTVLQVVIDWLKEAMKPFEWCHSCATSIHTQSLKQFNNCPTPFIFGYYAEFIDIDDPDVLAIDVDSGTCLQTPSIFKKFRNVIDRFGNSMSAQMGTSIYNFDSLNPESPQNHSVTNKGASGNGSQGSMDHQSYLLMHQKIDLNCKAFVNNLVKHIKICCLTPIKFSSEDYFEVIFNEAIFFHLLHRDKIKIERSSQDKYFFDSLMRTQLFSNLICSFFESEFDNKLVVDCKGDQCTTGGGDRTSPEDNIDTQDTSRNQEYQDNQENPHNLDNLTSLVDTGINQALEETFTV